MLNAQSAKIYFSEFAINTLELKNSWQQIFGELNAIKSDGNLAIKRKLPLSSSFVTLRQLNKIHKNRDHKLFFKKNFNT